MNNVVIGALLILFASAAAAQEPEKKCDCTSYPFAPNPPCYQQCVAKLSAHSAMLGEVKNIDPGVAVNISVLSQAGRSTVDFRGIANKRDLEEAAFRVVKDKNRQTPNGSPHPQN